MLTNSDFKVALDLSIIRSIAPQYTSPESNILANLFLKMKKLLTLTGDVKTIFKLQDINLPLNNFWSFFWIWNKVLLKNGNLTKTFTLGTFRTETLGVYSSLRNDLIHLIYMIQWIYEIQGMIVFYKDSLQMINFKMKCPDITTYTKTPLK